MNQTDFPLIVTAPVENADICEWLKNKKDQLEQDLARYGAILYRGFKAINALELGALVQSLSDHEFYNNEESSPRMQIAGNVYTSTHYRLDLEIFPHNENSYKKMFPMKLFFYCEQPSEEGGETPIVNCRQVYNKLDPKIKMEFAKKKWMYVRNFGNGIGIPWEESFNTSERSVVEQYCRAEDISFEWIRENSLRTKQVRNPFLKHPISGELSWFNHITFFNVATLDPEIREPLLEICDLEDLPHNTYYGDGTEIEPSVLKQLKDVYKSEAIDLKWQKGDLLIIDNLLTAHARKPFKGKRSIMLAQTDPIDKELLKVSLEQTLIEGQIL
jgi:alpha-ketoglutarate-dependent taurine dioxygenase